MEAPKAVDNSSTTRWSSAFVDNAWWQVDLGSAQSIDKVELNWEDAYASQYKILTSTDGTTFTDAATVSIASPGLKVTTFPARSARYVRVQGVTRATSTGSPSGTLTCSRRAARLLRRPRPHHLRRRRPPSSYSPRSWGPPG